MIKILDFQADLIALKATDAIIMRRVCQWISYLEILPRNLAGLFLIDFTGIIK